MVKVNNYMVTSDFIRFIPDYHMEIINPHTDRLNYGKDEVYYRFLLISVC